MATDSGHPARPRALRRRSGPGWCAPDRAGNEQQAKTTSSTIATTHRERPLVPGRRRVQRRGQAGIDSEADDSSISVSADVARRAGHEPLRPVLEPADHERRTQHDQRRWPGSTRRSWPAPPRSARSAGRRSHEQLRQVAQRGLHDPEHRRPEPVAHRFDRPVTSVASSASARAAAMNAVSPPMLRVSAAASVNRIPREPRMRSRRLKTSMGPQRVRSSACAAGQGAG